MTPTLDLPLVFAALMGVAILAYVVLDGYDLGVGMLMPAASPDEQQLMVASIGPFWDANETWLVLGVGVLLVAFPVAHGVVLTSLYLAVVVMLIGLMLRGVAFELRVKAHGWHRELWNWLFWLGSFVASFAQGVMLARYVTGFAPGPGYALFALVVGASLCGGYVLLGATWLVFRTEGPLRERALRWSRWGLLWVALGIAAVSLATPAVSATVRARWFDFPHTLGLLLLPLATAALWLWTWRATRRLSARASATVTTSASATATAGGGSADARHTPSARRAPRDGAPFAAAVAMFVLAFGGLAYSLFPYVVIDRLTIWDAAAHRSSLVVVGIGVAVVLPFVIAWSALSYRVFRGKVTRPLYD